MKITNRKLAIGIPLSWPMVPSAFFDSFIQMERPDFLYIRENNGPIEELRNNIVRRALASGCSHLIMMDTDMCFHPKTITRLMEHDLDIVGALCYRRYPPFDPIIYKGETNKYLNIDDFEPGSLVEVDATGTGCIMFKTKIFREMSDPWFKFRPNPNMGIGGIIGEDIGFCSDLRKAGYRIFVDTSIPSGHLTTLEVNQGTYDLYKILKKVQTEKKNKENGI